MPMYDYRCPACGHTERDVLAAVRERFSPCGCAPGTLMERVILPGKANAVIGDEIDVTIRHGLCDETTGEPIRWRSREALAKEAARRGLTNTVEHKGSTDSDRSATTSRWI